MSDPIADRMTDEQRAEWQALRDAGYAALREAHELYRQAADASRR